MATLVQVTLRTTDNLVENFVTNQFCTHGDVTEQPDMDNLVAAFQSFYNSIRSNVFPSTIAAGPHGIKLYAAGGPKPNYPYFETTFNMAGAGSGDPWPSEVALCLSFEGSKTPGFPQARRRGRIYVGPFKAQTGSTGRPGSTLINSLLDAAEGLWDDIDAIPSAERWAVWSPTDGDAVEIVNAWVDDAWDTQRSRGLPRTTRTIRDLT